MQMITNFTNAGLIPALRTSHCSVKTTLGTVKQVHVLLLLENIVSRVISNVKLVYYIILQ